MMERKPLSWKPVHSGKIYCAPACGRGCTWKAYQDAVKESAALAKVLGPSWKPWVHENLGWYFSARIRLKVGDEEIIVASVRCYGVTYSADLLNMSATGPTPKAALMAVIRLAADLQSTLARVMALALA